MSAQATTETDYGSGLLPQHLALIKGSAISSSAPTPLGRLKADAQFGALSLDAWVIPRAMRDAGSVGLITTRDVSRLSRNPIKLAAFFRANRRANVLLHIPPSH